MMWPNPTPYGAGECPFMSVEPVAGYLFNVGAPMSRTRIEHIRATLLGDTTRHGHWPALETVAIAFPDRVTPRQWCLHQLGQMGLVTPDDIRSVVHLPNRTLHCRSIPPDQFDRVLAMQPGNDPMEYVLRAAVILGKCSEDVYDPGRPAIWTNRGLIRAVELYDVGDFYAD